MAAFEVWFDAAREHAAALGVPIGRLLQAHDIVRGALSETWIEDQARSSSLGSGIKNVHPLYRSLIGGTLESVLDIAELASYLLGLRKDPQLPLIVASMRSAGKYASTIFEIALAWRWRRISATLEFYPPTAKGIADFGDNIDGHPTLIEASAFESDIFAKRSTVATQYAMDSLSGAAKRFPQLSVYVAAEIIVDTMVPNLQQEIHHEISKAVRAFVDAFAAQSPTQSRATNFGSILVRPALRDERSRLNEFSASSCIVQIKRPTIGSLHNVQRHESAKDTDWVHLLLKDQRADAMDRIAKKLKKENEQLRGSHGPRIIVLDISGLEIGIASPDAPDTAIMLDTFCRRHPSVSQIWLITKVWANQRHSYRGLVHRSPCATAPLTSETGERLLEVDSRIDVLAELAALA